MTLMIVILAETPPLSGTSRRPTADSSIHCLRSRWIASAFLALQAQPELHAHVRRLRWRITGSNHPYRRRVVGYLHRTLSSRVPKADAMQWFYLPFRPSLPTGTSETIGKWRVFVFRRH